MTTPETADLAGTAIDRLTPYLPGVAADTAEPAGPASAIRLYATIAGRLRALDESAALAEFVRRPENNSLVHRLLTTAVRADPAFAEELATALSATPAPPTDGADPADEASAARDNPAGSTTVRDDPGGSATTHGEPGRSTTVRDNPGGSATARDGLDASAAAGSSDGDGDGAPIGAGPGRAATPMRSKGPLVGLVVLVVLAVLGCLAARGILGDLRDSGGLSGQSSCEEFLRAPADEQAQAIQEIGLSKGISDLDSPLALPAVAHFCTAQPAARLGDVIARFGG